ncbi:integral membrane protein [Renibacterium salmoninarum ATCC 33209]|uniref:Integral membrane protein n=1 Tax=Renibacterium salmoninarum (strain ATCC 33209 / DSM 20767 / JCM 11484 / NBRC 15589 / NCIMB 2235) TaxID=288705 RepID=A9WRD1_RENSM|nr:YggT family protein [Renibacterium salmoninarum]ABY24213.1 integral membrane protein [Renibacterium salmoninarum ATCC 33209]
MPLIFALLYLLLFLFFLAMMVRLVFDWVQQLAREWRPRGIALVAATGVYSVTDPPVKLVRRLLPPLNLGAVSLDIGFLVLLFVTGIAMSITFTFAA